MISALTICGLDLADQGGGGKWGTGGALDVKSPDKVGQSTHNLEVKLFCVWH